MLPGGITRFNNALSLGSTDLPRFTLDLSGTVTLESPGDIPTLFSFEILLTKTALCWYWRTELGPALEHNGRAWRCHCRTASNDHLAGVDEAAQPTVDHGNGDGLH